MDSERAVLTKALSEGQIAILLANGIEVKHFSNTASGEECKKVFEYATTFARKFNSSPSVQMVKNNFPAWHDEPSQDALKPLIEEFKNLARRRHFSAAVLKLSRVADNPENWSKLDEIMLDAARDLAAVIPSGQISKVRAEMHERIDRYEVERQEGRRRGILCGIPLFDDLTDGFQEGDVITVAGYSGKGKSFISQFFLAHAIEQEKDALLISLEMSKRQIMERFDTMAVNFSHRNLRKMELSDEEITNWRKTAKKYENAKNDLILIDKPSNCTIDRIYAEISRYKPHITCVDYVQLMRGRNANQKHESLIDITNELKSVALSTDSTIIMVSQDNRSSAQEGSTESNMGTSVSVFQAADIYIGMMQDEFMQEQKKLLIRMLKNRNGSPAESDVLFEPEYGRMQPWDESKQINEFNKEFS